MCIRDRAEGEVKSLVEAGKVGFPEVQKVIQNLTNEGGMFYNLMQEQSKTITGPVSYTHLDDFEEAVIRLHLDNGQTKSYIKHRGRNEIEIPQSNETVCNIILGGKEISKSEYDRY